MGIFPQLQRLASVPSRGLRKRWYVLQCYSKDQGYFATTKAFLMTYPHWFGRSFVKSKSLFLCVRQDTNYTYDRITAPTNCCWQKIIMSTASHSQGILRSNMAFQSTCTTLCHKPTCWRMFNVSFNVLVLPLGGSFKMARERPRGSICLPENETEPQHLIVRWTNRWIVCLLRKLIDKLGNWDKLWWCVYNLCVYMEEEEGGLPGLLKSWVILRSCAYNQKNWFICPFWLIAKSLLLCPLLIS